MQKEEAESVKMLTAAGYIFTKGKPDEVTPRRQHDEAVLGRMGEVARADVVEALGKVRAALEPLTREPAGGDDGRIRPGRRAGSQLAAAPIAGRRRSSGSANWRARLRWSSCWW